MKKVFGSATPVILMISLLLASCNLPVVQQQSQAGSSDALTAQALAQTLTAVATRPPAAGDTPTQVPPSVIPAPTDCQAQLTTTTDMNVRAGPSTVYAVLGQLPTGSTVGVVGKNSDSSWWYIDFPAGPGGHGWIWGGGVTTTCIPANLAYVNPPPTPVQPTSVPTFTATNTQSSGIFIGTVMIIPSLFIPLALGDISPTELALNTSRQVYVRVLVSPSNSLSGSFQYKLYVDGGLVATKTATLPAGSQVFYSGYTLSPVGNHQLRVVLDSASQYFETNEGNNEATVNCTAGTLSCH